MARQTKQKTFTTGISFSSLPAVLSRYEGQRSIAFVNVENNKFIHPPIADNEFSEKVNPTYTEIASRLWEPKEFERGAGDALIYQYINSLREWQHLEIDGLQSILSQQGMEISPMDIEGLTKIVEAQGQNLTKMIEAQAETFRGMIEAQEKRFAEMASAQNRAIEALDRNISTRFAQLEKKIEGLDEKVSGLESRMGGVEQKLATIDERTRHLATKAWVYATLVAAVLSTLGAIGSIYTIIIHFPKH
ncbi:MAG: hypothetical protein AB7T01_11050 [Acidithiobacillus sp.]